MIGLVYLVVFGLLGLSVVYLLVSVYSRSVRREKLEKRFDAGDGEGDRDAYIEAGMKAYQHGLRRRLIWLVYIIPMAVVGVTIYFVN